MTTIDDRPTIAERYSSATESSNLKVTSERCGDADILIAAGWSSEVLGAGVARLRTEFDAVKAQTVDKGNCSATDTLLALMQLKSLQQVRSDVGEFAVAYATKTSFMRPDVEVLKLAGRVLGVFLEPLCGKCEGRGFTGGGRHEQSGPQVWCVTCGRTGRRKHRLGQDEEERRFMGGLLDHLERSSSRFEQQMSRRLHDRQEVG